MADDTVPEEWRQIAGFPDYSVSNHGRIRRDTDGPGPARAGSILRTPVNADGYPTTIISRDAGWRWVKVRRRERRTIRVNVVVCETFNGPAPSSHHVCAHNDGTRDNNHASNLRWATHKENMADAIAHGRTQRGTKHARFGKLTEAQVHDARRRLANGETMKSIADEFGVHETAIGHIRKGRSWAWLTQNGDDRKS